MLGKIDLRQEHRWGRVCMRTQSCLTLCDHMDGSTPGSSVHGILQARILEWVAISYSRGSSQPGDKPVSLMFLVLAGRLVTTVSPGKPGKAEEMEDNAGNWVYVVVGVCGHSLCLNSLTEVGSKITI